MTHHSVSTLAGVDLFDVEGCDDSGAREHVIEGGHQSSASSTPTQMRDAGALDHEFNQMEYLIACGRWVRRAQEQRDLAALRESRAEIRRMAARPESLFCRVLANYLIEQDRKATPWYRKRRRAARRDGQLQAALVA
jgi:hypothetical protein